jgi:phosphoglycerate dehydrogenase-like enzyme
VQLPWAGVEPYVDTIRQHPDRTWTCAKGAFAAPVAELALTLLLAGLRGLGTYARTATWESPLGRNLLGARVVVVGGGGIAESLLHLLEPFGGDVTVVRRQPLPMPGATRVVTADDLDDVIRDADALVLALALTPETDGLVDRRRLDLLADHAWLVNVARGRHVVTDDLVAALRDGSIGGAGLDVTEPEPLPDGHPLWTMPNVLITPHVGDTPEMAVPLLGARVRENVRRWAAGTPLLGLVDPVAGY